MGVCGKWGYEWNYTGMTVQWVALTKPPAVKDPPVTGLTGASYREWGSELRSDRPASGAYHWVDFDSGVKMVLEERLHPLIQ